MEIKPVGDRVLVRPDERESVSRGGIFIPETVDEKKQIDRGTVLAVGPGLRLADGTITPMEIKADDYVLYSRYAGTAVKLEGVSYIILRHEDVLGVIDRDKAEASTAHAQVADLPGEITC